MEKISGLTQKIVGLLKAVCDFKVELDKDGFSFDKLTILLPSTLNLMKSLSDLDGIKEEFLAAFKDDEKVVELLKQLLCIKNGVVELINAFKDTKALDQLVLALEAKINDK